MESMNFFNNLTVTPLNLRNGAVTNYTIEFDTDVFVLEEDILTF